MALRYLFLSRTFKSDHRQIRKSPVGYLRLLLLNSSVSPGNMKSYDTYVLIYVMITGPSAVNFFEESFRIDLHLKNDCY